MLKFNPTWRFHSPGAIAQGVQDDFLNLIGKVVAQVDRQRGLEHFKHYFANAAGATSSWSSSASWAETDLHGYMSEAGGNAPLFIEASVARMSAAKSGILVGTCPAFRFAACGLRDLRDPSRPHPEEHRFSDASRRTRPPHPSRRA
ncbi:MAG: hypothetical protein HY244_11950 [Rhizobiales bacterium]|nr:hypothetical protein [Hyphomicrobiales bacterium]